MSAVQTVKGRTCASCTLCCKVLAIAEVPTPRDAWCPHCAVGKGCNVYDARPEPCRTFHCGYLIWDAVPDHWFPAKAKIVVVSELGFRINFYVDASQPGRWREKPWDDDIKALAIRAIADGRQVLVTAGARVFAIFPDRDVDLGSLSADEAVVTGKRPDGTWGAAKVAANDPRLAQLDGGLSLGGLIPLR